MSTEQNKAVVRRFITEALSGRDVGLAVERLGPATPGFLGATRYEVLDNPDIVVEIAEWESAEARATAMQQAMDSGAYAPLGELLGAPFRAPVIRQLP
jgi:hypothetical protein